MSDIRHIEAILTLADRELATPSEMAGKAGIYFALLDQAVPFLRELLEVKKAKAEKIAAVRQQLAIAESNCSERSDPASNEENDAEVTRLRMALLSAIGGAA